MIQSMQIMPHDIKVLAFDVFGTVVDWRSSVIAEGEQLGKANALQVDWPAFADAWRSIYRRYKSNAEVYLLVPQLFDLNPEQVMMVAAHEHDLQAAQKHGLRTAFIHRPLERGPGKAAAVPPTERYDFVAKDMLDLAGQLGT